MQFSSDRLRLDTSDIYCSAPVVSIPFLILPQKAVVAIYIPSDERDQYFTHEQRSKPVCSLVHCALCCSVWQAGTSNPEVSLYVADLNALGNPGVSARQSADNQAVSIKPTAAVTEQWVVYCVPSELCMCRTQLINYTHALYVTCQLNACYTHVLCVVTCIRPTFWSPHTPNPPL